MTNGKAENVLRIIKKRLRTKSKGADAGKMSMYRCRFCGTWHIGNSPR